VISFRNLYLTFLSALFVAITNIPYFIKAFANAGITDSILVVSTNILITSLIFSLFLFSRHVYFLINLVILCLNSGGAYYLWIYKISLSREAVEAILVANLQEVNDSFDYQIWLWGLVLGILPSMFIYRFSKKFDFSIKNWLTTFIASLAILLLYVMLSIKFVWHVKFYERHLRSFMPYNYLTGIAQHAKAKKHSKTEKTNPYTAETNNFKGLKFIFIIGESARSDRFSLNGYERNTNPYLTQVDSLLSFKNAFSLATSTMGGVQSMFVDDTKKNDYSLLKLMEQNGFKTFWLSNQRFEDDIVTSIGKEAQVKIFRDKIVSENHQYNYDELMIPYFQTILDNHKEDNLFIVLHTFGSHYGYDLRYPDEFIVFQPTCKENSVFFDRKNCTDISKINNSYDNTILYTDQFIFNIIEMVKNYNSVVFYASDHGESLGENGVFLHSANYETAPIEQLHIPVLLWGSDELLKNQELSTNFQKAKNKVNTKFTQHNIFHSIPHCIGFKANIDAKKSICY